METISVSGCQGDKDYLGVLSLVHLYKIESKSFLKKIVVR